MKNLKKVLALALAFAMSLTLFAGAAFTDEASIGANYADDVAMLTQLGVIGGYADGSFKPQGNITRAETTKLIYVLKYGYDDAGKLFSGAKSIFTDVENNANVSWAKGYINYCSNQGIVGGIGNNKFNPNGNVTVAELSKMLLVSLGADAAKEGYGGSNWAANVVADAMEFGVFDGWTGDPTGPATRELACKLMANTIFAPIYTYSAITGTGSQYDINNNKNQTLGEKTMGLKHVNGIVVANGRYSIDRDADGQKWATYDNPYTPTVKKDKSTIVYEVTNEYGAVTGYEDVTIDVDLSDEVLGNLVDVYFKADGTDGNYSNITLVGDVLINSKTVAYDVMAADIEITPDGDSASSKDIKPALNFTTADGETKTVEPRAYYGDGKDPSSVFTSGRVSQQKAYNGAAFADRIYVLEATSINPEATRIAQPEFEEAKEANGYNPGFGSNDKWVEDAVTDMGANELRSYRFVSVDGGATISYIFASSRMDVGRVGTYNDSTITVSGAGGTLDLGDEAIVNGTVEKGMDVVTYAKDGLVYIEPTETISGKATNFYNKTATINGAIYRAAVAELGDEIDEYFTSGEGKNRNNDSTEYVVYKNYILKADGTASTGAANDYAVVLHSGYDTDTGVVTVKFGFPNNTEGTYEVTKLNNNEATSESLKWNFINNRMVGAVLRVTIANGMANLSQNDPEELNAKTGANTGVNSANPVARVEDGMFHLYARGTQGQDDYVGSKTFRADENSVVFMLYGGTKSGAALKGDVAEGGNATLYALKAKAYKLQNISDAAGATEAVWANIGGAAESQKAANTEVYMGDAVATKGSNGMSVLLAGSLSVGESAGSGIGDMDNIAYIVKAEENYNADTEQYYIDVVMINHNGIIDTRTVDNVTDDDGDIIVKQNIGEEIFKPGEMVLYQMTASEDEADTREWIQTLSDNAGLGSYDKVYNYTVNKDLYDAQGNFADAGYFAVQIGIVDDEYIGFFANNHSQTGEEDGWADSMFVEEIDEYNFAVIAIDDNTFVEGGDIETISDSDVITANDSKRVQNAIICVEGGKIVRVFTLYNMF